MNFSTGYLEMYVFTEEYFSRTIFLAMQCSNLIEKKLQKNVLIQKHQNPDSDFRVYYLQWFGKVARNCHAPCSYSIVLEEVNLNSFLAGLQVKQSLLIYLIEKLTNRRPIHWNILFSKPYRRQLLTYILMG